MTSFAPSPQANWLGQLLLGVLSLLILGCSNNPYPSEDAEAKVVYQAFSTPPKTLDPAVSYTTAGHEFTAAIYEPLLEYHYFERPYRLVAGTAESVPEAQPLPDGRVAYDFKLREGQRFADDVCFPGGKGRPVLAADFAYELARIADPQVGSPVLEPFSIIDGFVEFRERVKKLREGSAKSAREIYQLAGGIRGVQVEGPRDLRIVLKEPYPQILYWFALPFSAAVPYEAVEYYDGEEGRDLFGEHPVGSGPFQLSLYDKRARIVLEQNANWYGHTYPQDGPSAPGVFFPEKGPGGRSTGKWAGRRMPFVERLEYRREEESIPLFSKFLQGYYERSGTYDIPGISRDNFDRVIQNGQLSAEMKARGMVLEKTITPTIYYIGFNLDDAVVGRAAGERSRKLRQAMSLVIDSRDYLQLFYNDCGIKAESLLPPGLYGYDENYKNPFRKKDLAYARRLLAEAGYDKGIDPKTGRPLRLSFDAAQTSPRAMLIYQFYVSQWRALGIDVQIEATNYNKFQEKVRDGAYQIFQWGWQADYPDPENFFFLLTSNMARSVSGGPNTANFKNARFDELYGQMRNRENDAERLRIIQEMRGILEQERPWIEMFHDEEFSVAHGWYENLYPQGMSNPTQKFVSIDASTRARLRTEWNRPILWPAFVLVLLLLLLVIPLYRTYKQERL